jgi:hypothetical protein
MFNHSLQAGGADFQPSADLAIRTTLRMLRLASSRIKQRHLAAGEAEWEIHSSALAMLMVAVRSVRSLAG